MFKRLHFYSLKLYYWIYLSIPLKELPLHEGTPQLLISYLLNHILVYKILKIQNTALKPSYVPKTLNNTTNTRYR